MCLTDLVYERSAFSTHYTAIHYFLFKFCANCADTFNQETQKEGKDRSGERELSMKQSVSQWPT